MGSTYDDAPPRPRGKNQYTINLQGGQWRVVDPVGVVMSPRYPNCRAANRSASYLTRLAKLADSKIGRPERPYVNNFRRPT